MDEAFDYATLGETSSGGRTLIKADCESEPMLVAAQPGSGGPSTGQRGHVVIVDDDVSYSKILSRALRKEGYLVTRAQDGAAAVAALDGSDFDAALLDVNLPDAHGPDLIALLHGKRPRLQVIVMTGQGSIDMAMQSVRAGAFEFVEKNSVLSGMLRTVEHAVQHRRALDETALYQASQAIFDARHFERLPETLVTIARQVMSADAVSLLLPGADGKLYVAHAYGLAPDVQSSTRITIGEGIAGRVAASGTPVIINGRASDYSEFADAASHTRVKSSIVYPLRRGDRLVGLLTFNRLSSDRPYRSADLDTAAVLASQALLALENLRLSKQSAMNERLAAVGQLSTGIVHEINTPVQYIGDGQYFLREAFEGLLELLAMYERLVEQNRSRLADTPLLAEIAAHAEQIDPDDLRVEVPKTFERTSEGLARVTEIIRSVKTFGRTDRAEKELIDIDRLVDDTLTMSRSEYKYVADVEKQIADVPQVMAHPGEIGQVLLNLVVNAAHAIAEKSRTQPDPARGKIVVRATATPTDVIIEIEDDGPGIPDAIQARVFEPFFTTKDSGKGTGLGLAIARGIVVDKHQGEIRLESKPGLGTKFFVRLPIAAP